MVSGISTNNNKTNVNTQLSTGANTQSFTKLQEANPVVEQSLSKPSNVSPKPDLKIQKVENQQNAAQEAIYFCGAETKKGTPCTRRVKGGGRCWQHAGRLAILPQKLVASR